MEQCQHFKHEQIKSISKEINLSRMAGVVIHQIAICELSQSKNLGIGHQKLICGGDRKECIFDEMREK